MTFNSADPVYGQTGGSVAKLNMGGQVPNGKQMPSRVTDLLKMLRES